MWSFTVRYVKVGWKTKENLGLGERDWMSKGNRTFATSDCKCACSVEGVGGCLEGGD